ncbi:MAG: high-potential iron-sulfur protein [Bdellovibrionaceae bacterium]|nr:high-potential iron-sulfur protein [Pseudobdellovibrionaceae bacterium]
MEQKNSRRQFFTFAGTMLGLAALAPAVLTSTAFAEERRRARPEGGAAPAAGGAGELPMAVPGKGPAAAMNYVIDHKDVKDAALKIERGGVPFEKQYCATCNFYTKGASKNGKEIGKCSVLPANMVEGTAWCSTWSKKA